MARIPIVVIGASAGGVEAISRIASDLPKDFGAAVFVVMHFPSFSTSVLPRILARAGKLPATHASHGERFQSGHIYVAPPDHHMLLDRRCVSLARGAKENGNRPAIDPLFRSAAVAHGAHVIGIVLTGNLDDGTAGLVAIKRHGGITVAQDPHDAAFPSMPTSAIEHANVDHVLRLDEIVPALVEVTQAIVSIQLPAPVPNMDDETELETRYAEGDLAVIQDPENHPGHVSQFGCPDCGGVLWQIKDGELVRFRCRVGHAWSADGLMARQATQMEDAMWTALRALEESASLNQMMADRATKRGNDLLAVRFDRAARTAERRSKTIRDVLGAEHVGVAADTPKTEVGGTAT